MDEFSLIRNYLAPLAGPEGLNLTDDAAVLTPPAGHDLIITKDTMVEGVHFPRGHYGLNVASRLLRVNLSDLAAKGAAPLGYLLSIAWPKSLSSAQIAVHMESFAAGLKDVQQAYSFTLFGGDTVRTDGPMVVSATLIGTVPHGGMVRRAGANIGDDIWVTGTIGDGYLGLKYISQDHVFLDNLLPYAGDLETAYWRPIPRLGLSKLLRDVATSAVDISDGLLSDIRHIAQDSGIKAVIDIYAVPLSGAGRQWLKPLTHIEQKLILAAGGDDYEVGFTADPKHRELILESALLLSFDITRIGTCLKGSGMDCLGANAAVLDVSIYGFSHI